MQFKTIGIVFVNDEVLAGTSEIDRECEILTKVLNNLGFGVKKISIVEERPDAVSRELSSFSKSFDVVLVVSRSNMSTVSTALVNMISEEAVFRKELANFGEVTRWPKSVKLLEAGASFPVIYFHQIFIVCSTSIEEQILSIRDHLQQYRRESVFVKLFDVPLNGFKYLESKYNLKIDTQMLNGKEMLRISSKQFDDIVKGEIDLQTKVGKDGSNSVALIDTEDLVWNSSEHHIKSALQSIEKCFEMYRPENTFLSFNGGKDCTVLQHLVQIVLKKKYPHFTGRMLCLYVRSDCAFKEQDDFIAQCSIHYNLEVITIVADIKQALLDILAQRPGLKACFMGTRRTDPYSADLETFQMTDRNWPEIMRCSPLLDWHYSDIWDYILFYKVPYCKLYDYGYTSLGNSINTVRNPSLFCPEDQLYLPAYKMLNEKHERDGRNKQVSKI